MKKIIASIVLVLASFGLVPQTASAATGVQYNCAYSNITSTGVTVKCYSLSPNPSYNGLMRAVAFCTGTTGYGPYVLVGTASRATCGSGTRWNHGYQVL